MKLSDVQRDEVLALLPHLKPSAYLRRAQLAAVLTFLGYPISEATLATMKTRGGGPTISYFGRAAIYEFGPAIEWAQSRVTTAVQLRKAA